MIIKIIRKTQIFHYSFFLLLITTILLFSCDDSLINLNNTKSENLNPALSKSNLNKENIQKFAKLFSKYLEDIENQKLLEEKIKNSTYVENIVEATELLETDVERKIKNKSVKRKIKKELLELNKNNGKDFENWFNNLKYGEIDIYFPVKEHREKWKAGDDLLIVGFIPSDDNKKEPVTAYGLNGTEVQLSQETVPETAALVIYPSEKGKNYKKGADTGTSDKISFAPMLPVDPPPPPDDNWYNCTWTGILVAHDYEGWLMGSMEIFLKLKYRYSSNDPWVGWTNSSGIPQHRIDGVDAGHWKRGQYQEILRLTQNFEMYVEVWEYDEYPNPSDFVADHYYNVIKECGETGTAYPSNLIRCNFDPCVDFFLQDGIYPGSDYDMVELHFNRRYEE